MADHDTKQTTTSNITNREGENVSLSLTTSNTEPDLSQETKQLINDVYKSRPDGSSAVIDKFRAAKKNISTAEGLKEWDEQLVKFLKRQKRYEREEKNLTEKIIEWRKGRGTAAASGLEYVESTELKVSADLSSRNETDIESQSFRKLLRSDSQIELLTKRNVDRNQEQLLKRVFDATRQDLINLKATNQAHLERLLKGQTLTKKEEKEAKEFTSHKIGAKDRALLGMINATRSVANRLALNPQDARTIGNILPFSSKNSIYDQVHKDLHEYILSNPALHPDLWNPFGQAATFNPNITKYERKALEQSSKQMDEMHKKDREALNEQIKAKNESFFKELEDLSKKNSSANMVYGRLVRMLLIANPFLGGVLAGSMVFAPIISVLKGAQEFNDMVLGPIKFIFGDDIAGFLSGLVSKIPLVSDILNVPNELIGAATQNSAASAIFGGSQSALSGPLAQLGIAAVSMLYETDKTMQMEESKDKTLKSAKKSFRNVFKDFNKNQDAKRKAAIKQFAEKHACTIKEKEHLNDRLQEDVKKIMSDLNDEEKTKLTKILQGIINKSHPGEILTPDKLGELLKRNVFNKEFQDLLLLSRILRENEGNINKLKEALISPETYDKLLKSYADQIEAKKDFLTKEVYGLDEQTLMKDKTPEILEKLEKSDPQTINKLANIAQKIVNGNDSNNTLSKEELEKFLIDNISNSQIQDLLLVVKSDLESDNIDRLNKNSQSIENFEKYLQDKQSSIKGQRQALKNEASEKMDAAKKIIIEKYAQEQLMTYFNLALKPKSHESKTNDSVESKDAPSESQTSDTVDDPTLGNVSGVARATETPIAEQKTENRRATNLEEKDVSALASASQEELEDVKASVSGFARATETPLTEQKTENNNPDLEEKDVSTVASASQKALAALEDAELPNLASTNNNVEAKNAMEIENKYKSGRTNSL